jgi:type II secretory pathway component PulF
MISVIQETGSLTSALSELNIFGPEVLYQVKGGELSGELAEVLLEISRTFETNSSITRNLLVIMIYPTILVAILFAAIYIISTFVMPQIMELVKEINAPLTPLSKVVIAVTGFISRCGGHIILTVAAAVVGLVLSLRCQAVRHGFDARLLKLVIVRDIARMRDLIRFSNVFYSLFQSGVDLETCLDCAAGTVKNYVLKTGAIQAKRLIIKDGIDFAEALAVTGIYDNTELQLIDIGAGVSLERLCEVFKTMSARTAQVLEAQVKALFLLIEPAIILVLGTIAGLFVVGIYSPIYAIVNAM